MTWNTVKNFRDNQIITAEDWNNILGANGNVSLINKMINTRSACNVSSSIISDQNVLKTASFTTAINRLAFYNSNPPFFSTGDGDGWMSFQFVNENTNYFPFYNSVRSSINQAIDGIPFILLWQFKLSTQNSANLSAMRVRTTVEREYRTSVNGSQTTTETISASFFRSFSTSTETDYFSASLCYASHNVTDRYFVTVSHDFNANLTAYGQIRVIANPGIV